MYNTSEVIKLYNTEMCIIDHVHVHIHVHVHVHVHVATCSANTNIKFSSSVQFDVP